MKLETERLILRSPSLDDAEKMFSNWCSDPEVTKYLTWLPHENIEETKRILNIFLEREKGPKHHQAFICLKSNEPIGSIDIVNYHDDGNPEIGYCLSRKYWNQGIMTEACTAFVDYLFGFGFSKIYICADVRNIGSNRVIEKCGFKFLYTEHKDHCSQFKSEPVDDHCYELTKGMFYGKA